MVQEGNKPLEKEVIALRMGNKMLKWGPASRLPHGHQHRPRGLQGVMAGLAGFAEGRSHCRKRFLACFATNTEYNKHQRL